MNDTPKSLFQLGEDEKGEYLSYEYEVRPEYSYVDPKTGKRFPTSGEDVDNYRKAHYEVSRRFVTGWEKI